VAGDVNVTGMSYTNPHRLTGATIGGIGHTFQYDLAGNITKYVASGADDTELDYDARGQVTRITLGSQASPTARDQFWYDPDGDRFLKRATWSGGGDAWVLYLLGGAFEQIHPVSDATITRRRQVQVSGTVAHRHTLAANGTETTALEYRHRDHLGSVSAVTDASGAIQVKPAFEPFGARRQSDWTGDLVSPAGVLMGLGSTTDRGYTDHEHLDRTGFIHHFMPVANWALGSEARPGRQG
jgi:YD repeat-containing protein